MLEICPITLKEANAYVEQHHRHHEGVQLRREDGRRKRRARRMTDYISREAAIAYIREQSEECQKAFEELGGENGIYADAYNDLAEEFYRIPAADVAPIEALERLRDELCAQELITMRGLKRLNALIWKYTTVHDGG